MPLWKGPHSWPGAFVLSAVPVCSVCYQGLPIRGIVRLPCEDASGKAALSP